MSSPRPERYIPVHLRLLADHPALLEGLDHWLRLGLISEQDVQTLCQHYLSCAVPIPEAITAFPVAQPVLNEELATPQPLAALQTEPPQALVPATPGWISQFLTRLINEVSVIWLLCLGVFLVVVSSAVLAASQWQAVSAVGQYGILLAYTAAFVIAGLWAGTKSQLQITAEMLKVASLLITPVNFWVMDSFKLLYSPAGIGLAVIAAVGLSGATVALLPRPRTSTGMLANAIGLSWLHWGWGWTGVPLAATYVGCIGTSLVLFTQQRPPSEPERSAGWSRISPIDIVLPFAVLLLLFRAGVMAAVPIAQLGLAFGICGWLLCWLARENPSKVVWNWIGAGLLVGGGLVSIGAEPPWQALLISGLGLWLLGDRLRRDRQPVTLVAMVGLALVSGTLVQRMVPVSIRDVILSAWIAQVGAQGMPEVLWGISLYPYLLGILVFIARIRRGQQPALLKTAYVLAGMLGIGVLGLSLTNPILRSLSLWLVLLPLGMALRHSSSAVLIYLMNGLGLAAVYSTLDNLAPNLAMHQWGISVLCGMGLEWIALLLLARFPRWQQSTWFVGMGLAGLGYLLLFAAMGLGVTAWGGSALVIPVALSALLFFPQFRWVDEGLGLSVVSMVAVQILTFDGVGSRLTGLALGALLMLLNTMRRPNLVTAILSVGFGLTFSYAMGWEWFSDRSFHNWVLLSTGLLWALVALRNLATLGNWNLSRPLKLALDGWAIALMLWVSLPLAVYGLWVTKDFTQWVTPQIWIYPVSSVLILAALVYRYWQAPAQGWLVGIAWAGEVSLICGLKYYFGQPIQRVAIATLALGFLTVLLGEGQVHRTGQPYRWSWHLIALGYGTFGWLLSHTEWTATTGLYTIALALIALGVGRRQPPLMPITVLGLIGISAGAFELLLYPLLKAVGGQPGDGYVALAGLALVLAVANRLLDYWGPRLLNLAPNSLSILGHVHWGLGTVLLVIALGLNLSSTGEWVWGAELLLLGGYALFQGKQQPFWIYLGLGEIYLAVGQTLYTNVPAAQLLPWASAIASAFSLGLYSLPWPRWGWVKPPFFHVGLVVPLLVTLLSVNQVNISSLLLSGSFYGWLAFLAQTPRLSYIALLLANGAALKLLHQLNLTDRIWSVSLVGLSLLFVVQMDPALRSPSRRSVRHLLRCFAVGLIAVTTLYESDAYFWSGVLTIGLSLGMVLLGLLLRVRAFLYVGTLTFAAKVLRLVWLFITDESLVLWALGIALGLVLIWVAATFEARRSQMTALLQYWVTALEEWQ